MADILGEFLMSYQSERRRQKRLRAIEFLGSRCVVCHTTENLEFDHIDYTTKAQHSHARHDPTKKGSRSNRPLWDRSWVYVESVLPAYQLLCRDCHRDKNAEERTARWGHRPHWEHGTITGYAKCRCRECRDAINAYMRRRARRQRRQARLSELVALALDREA